MTDAGRHFAGTGQTRVAYLFTTSDKPSETFLRREMTAMRGLGLDIRVISLWGGEDTTEVRRVPLPEMLTLIWKAPKELVTRPEVYAELFSTMLDSDIPSWINFGENWRGIGCAVLLARELKNEGIARTHAVWATMPAAAAWVIRKMTGIPFTMGAHAYDVFENGGDWLLPLKARDAALVHCSTQAAKNRIVKTGCNPSKVVVVRRGMDTLPFAMKPLRTPRKILRLVSVGRFVEKKGFRAQIRLYSELEKLGLDFEARLVGTGPLEDEIRHLIDKFRLGDRVELTGWLDETGVSRQLEWADAFLFTGRIAQSGDRDGLPNALAEAMAHGVPVLSTPVGAIPEVIASGINGILLDAKDTTGWFTALCNLRDNDAFCEELRRCARKWTEVNFDARRNAAMLKAAIEEKIAMSCDDF